MPKIGSHREAPSTTTRKTETETTKPTQQETKGIPEKEQGTIESKPLSQDVKTQKRTDKQYSGLMKRIWVDGKAPKGQPGQSGPKIGTERTTPAESKTQPQLESAPKLGKQVSEPIQSPAKEILQSAPKVGIEGHAPLESKSIGGAQEVTQPKLTGEQMLSDLKNLSPEISEHINKLGITKIELKESDPNFSTGAYFNQKDKSIVVRYDGTQKPSELMDNILFESCNFENEHKFKQLDKDFGARKLNPEQYGKGKAEVEFQSTIRYCNLLKSIPDSTDFKKNPPFQAQRAMKFTDEIKYPGPTATPEQIKMAKEAYDQRPHGRFSPNGTTSTLPTWQMYTYEKLQKQSETGVMGQFEKLRQHYGVSQGEWTNVRAPLKEDEHNPFTPVQKLERYQQVKDDLRTRFDTESKFVTPGYDLTPQMQTLMNQQKTVLGLSEDELKNKLWPKWQQAGGSKTDFDQFVQKQIPGFENPLTKEGLPDHSSKISKFGDIISYAQDHFPGEQQKDLFKDVI